MNSFIKKINKDRIIIFLVLILSFCFISRGVYSYYFSRAELGGKDTVPVSIFDIQVNSDDDYIYYLGDDSAHISLTCDTAVGGSGTVYCTGSLDIYNYGATKVAIDIVDSDSSIYAPNGLDGTAGAPNFNWTSTTIDAGGSARLTVSIAADIDSPGLNGEQYYYVTSPVYDQNCGIYLNVSLKAYQVK